MDEAKASFNGYFRSPQGNRDQFTLRQADEQSDKDFIVRVRNFVKLLAENGWTEWYAAENESGGENGGDPQSEIRNAKSFEVESIKLAAGGDHPRWVVRGGKFVKYGVTCWPETLHAAGMADKLDPLKDNKPKGAGWHITTNARTTRDAGCLIK